MLVDLMITITNKFIPTLPIDIVYLWVDGEDPEWRMEKQFWQKNYNISTKRNEDIARFIQHNELKYSLRSIVHNIPWIDTIYIITNGQFPPWLNISHPKIKLITHDAIMPKDSLPTFNSVALEACLPNIPGLHEHFLFANDDTFVYRPATPLFFYATNGNPKIRIGLSDLSTIHWEKMLYSRIIMRASQLLKEHYGVRYTFEPSHNIMAYRKDDYLNCISEFKDAFNITTYSKFRSDKCVHRTLVAYYSVAHRHSSVIWNHSQEFVKDTLYIPLSDESTIRQLLDRHKPTLICINDEESSSDKNRAGFSSLLERLFPWKCEWELSAT